MKLVICLLFLIGCSKPINLPIGGCVRIYSQVAVVDFYVSEKFKDMYSLCPVLIKDGKPNYLPNSCSLFSQFILEDRFKIIECKDIDN